MSDAVLEHEWRTHSLLLLAVVNSCAWLMTGCKATAQPTHVTMRHTSLNAEPTRSRTTTCASFLSRSAVLRLVHVSLQKGRKRAKNPARSSCAAEARGAVIKQ